MTEVPIPPPPPDPAEAALLVGAKVEVRYQGKARYYPGHIARVHGNGTYDIDYDDGEKESGVDKELIKPFDAPKPAASSSATAATGGGFRKGDKVQVRYQGKSTYYPGRISRARLNGTYDIDYDDGDEESGVDKELIKPLDPAEAERLQAEAERGFREGDKVEVRYRGKSKYYPGLIARVHGDGTYDIAYDDGEKETGVRADLIKLIKAIDPAEAERLQAEKERLAALLNTATTPEAQKAALLAAGVPKEVGLNWGPEVPLSEFDGVMLHEDGTVARIEIAKEGRDERGTYVNFDLDAIVRPISTLQAFTADGCRNTTGAHV